MIVDPTLNAFDDVVPECSVSICPLCFIKNDYVAVSENFLFLFHVWVFASKDLSKTCPGILVIEVTEVLFPHPKPKYYPSIPAIIVSQQK